MSDFHTDDALDTLLRTALAEVPEPATAEDFAGRVLAMARPVALPTPPRAVSAWPVWAAAIAIAAVVCIGVLRVMDLSAMSSASTTTLSDAVSTDSVALLPIGGVVFLIAIAWAVGRSAFHSPEPGLVAAVA